MKTIVKLTAGLALVVVLGLSPGTVHGLSLAEKANLQAAMQRHIDRNAVDGMFLYFDQASNSVRGLHPVTTHPKILTVDDYYVVCFDFRDDAGKHVNVDFFMAPRDDTYVVFHTSVDGDKLVGQLVREGRASLVQ